MKAMAFELFYRLDNTDRIVETGGAWNQFAKENAGTELLGSAVIGRSLYDFIHGDVSRMFVRTLVDGVRILNRPRVVPYRCDSPGLRRYMEMSITCEPGGGILLEHRQVREETISRNFDFKVGVRSVNQLIVRCSHCNTVKKNGVWGEPETVLLEGDKLVPVIYGVCETCLNLVKRR